jgi:hypothetical protein
MNDACSLRTSWRDAEGTWKRPTPHGRVRHHCGPWAAKTFLVTDCRTEEIHPLAQLARADRGEPVFGSVLGGDPHPSSGSWTVQSHVAAVQKWS